MVKGEDEQAESLDPVPRLTSDVATVSVKKLFLVFKAPSFSSRFFNDFIGTPCICGDVHRKYT